nr:reverse transcriptase domain-containing protein [Tanacetum cinerariifolium]
RHPWDSVSQSTQKKEAWLTCSLWRRNFREQRKGRRNGNPWGPTEPVLQTQKTPSPSLAFIKENIDVLRTPIKEHDQQAKMKATPRKLAYADSDKEALAGSLAKGFSNRFSLKSSGTSDTQRQTLFTIKSQKTSSINKEPTHLRRSRSVDTFKELSQKFLEEFSQQKRYAKDPTEIHGIKKRQNEGLQAFMDRFKSKSSHIKGVPPVLRISAFIHGHSHSELSKKLNDKIPKIVDEMFERVRAFIRGEVAIRSAEMVRPSQRDKGYVPPTWTGGPERAKNREVMALGKLAHLVKDIRPNNQRDRKPGRNGVKVINMIRREGNHKRSFEERRSELTSDPMSLERTWAERMKKKHSPSAMNFRTKGDEEKTGFHTEEEVYCFTHIPKELKKLRCYASEDDEKGLSRSKRMERGNILGRNSNKKQKKKADGPVVKNLFGQGEQVEETPDANKWGIFDLSKGFQANSTPTTRAWRLYLGRETIEEGSGVGIILISPEEKMYSYVIRLKFKASNHAMDYEALLEGLAASTNKGMATIKLEFLNQEVSVGIKTRPSVEETSSSKKGKATSKALEAQPNCNHKASGSN